MANNWDNQVSSQTTDNRSFSSTFQMYENLVYGYDGSNAVAIKTNSDGELVVNLEASTLNIGDVDVLSTVLPTALVDTPEYFEDTSFVVGDSPATLDINTALGRNATKGYIINDGAGNFTVSFSTDGAAFGDDITMKKNEIINFKDLSVDSLRITWVADSAYRVSAV